MIDIFNAPIQNAEAGVLPIPANENLVVENWLQTNLSNEPSITFPTLPPRK